MAALQQAFVGKVSDVLVHRGQRFQAEAAGDLIVGRGIFVLTDKVGEKVEDFFLPAGDGHEGIIEKKKRSASGTLVIFCVLRNIAVRLALLSRFGTPFIAFPLANYHPRRTAFFACVSPLDTVILRSAPSSGACWASGEGTMRILIAEDDAALGLFLRRGLE